MDNILTEKEKEILTMMYEHMDETLRVINADFTPNDLYYLMEKIGLYDVVSGRIINTTGYICPHCGFKFIVPKGR